MIVISHAQVGRTLLIAYLTVALGSSDALAQPSPEWKPVFTDYAAFVHTGSISLEKIKDGSKVLKVWTSRNLESPMQYETIGTVKSIKTLWTIYCEERISTQEFKMFPEPNAQGKEMMPSRPVRTGLDALQPETLGMALRDKYCSSWAFWR